MKIAPLFLLTAILLAGLAAAAQDGAAAQQPGVAPAPAADPKALTPEQQALARLFHRAGAEPLFALAAPAFGHLPEALAGTELGQLFYEPTYEKGRAEWQRLLDRTAGAPVAPLWQVLRERLKGPALIAVLPGRNEGGLNAPFELRLLLTAADAESAKAVEAAWPRVAPDAGSLLSVLRLDVATPEALAAAEAPPPWAEACARAGGLLRLSARPKELAQALDALIQEAGDDTPPAWLAAAREIAQADVARIEWDLDVQGKLFAETLRLEPGAEAKASFHRLLAALRDDPQPWQSLLAALPAGHDVWLLAQGVPATLGEDLLAALQDLEGVLRGKKWRRTEGQEEAARDPKRFDFFTQSFTGTLGIAASPSVTGEVRLAAAFPTDGAKVEDLRERLRAGLAATGADFQTQKNAARIHVHAPLAAAFKGRSFLPAPVIGLSDGWMWLCSNTAAYGELTQGFLRERTLDKSAPKAVREEKTALHLYVNLTNIVPLLYTAWLFGGGGPEIGGWQVPLTLLPSPVALAKHLGEYHASLRRDRAAVLGSACGPWPGGALLPVFLLATAGDEIEDHKSRRAEAVRNALDTIDAKDDDGGKDEAGDAGAGDEKP
ncbi:MAG: hypothetical protein L6R28_25285 [Planctomycetes bacterium]|nr:hypothetical protein [Planctomycetota bacterium]